MSPEAVSTGEEGVGLVVAEMPTDEFKRQVKGVTSFPGTVPIDEGTYGPYEPDPDADMDGPGPAYLEDGIAVKPSTPQPALVPHPTKLGWLVHPDLVAMCAGSR